MGERRAGADVTLEFWPSHVQRYQIPRDQIRLPGEIRVWDPPHVFEWMWDVDLMRFELSPERLGTRLVFTTWFGQPDAHDNSPARRAAGYHICLDQLQELVESGHVRVPLVDRSTDGLEQVYEQSRHSTPGAGRALRAG